MNVIGRIARRLRVHFERDHDILGTTIRLPAGHMLDWIRLHHPRYDMPLSDVSDEVVRKYKTPSMIDIGANIGDTAAFMTQSDKSVSLLCIEGNASYLAFLRKNLAALAGATEIVEAYVGAYDGRVEGQIVANNGTAGLAAGNGTVPTRSLAAILADHPNFAGAKLLKIDTDGHDAKIVFGALDMLKKMKPVLFVEYYPLGDVAVATECRRMIEGLADSGYTRFHVFDNFGNHMLRFQAGEIDQMRSLTAYVRAQQRSERPSINYYDVCAFHAEDSDLSDRLLKRYDWDG